MNWTSGLGVASMGKMNTTDSSARRDLYTWPDPGASALLTIDMQCDFSEGGSAAVAGTRVAIPAMVRVLEAYRRRGLPVIHVIRLYRADGSNVDLCRRARVEAGARIVEPGTAGAELVAEFGAGPVDAEALLGGALQAVGEREWLMYKPRWDAFHGTELEAHLRRMGATTLAVVGCNFPNCPRTTAYGASMRDLRVVVIRDAVSGVYERGIAELNGIGMETPTADEWVVRVEQA